ncbi:hypothetical protein [Streptomyces sp. NPDC014734]|uniref:hypothetical protein n=1 Tax=Streptomyces sp. NPDC014734 TaxID=3364886 RepID=UPI0036FE18C1
MGKPGAQELGGGEVEVEGAARQPEAAVGQIEVTQGDGGGLGGQDGVDGGEGDKEAGKRRVSAVEEAGEPVARQGAGQRWVGGQVDAAGGVAEDDALLFQGAEEAAQNTQMRSLARRICELPRESQPYG